MSFGIGHAALAGLGLFNIPPEAARAAETEMQTRAVARGPGCVKLYAEVTAARAAVSKCLNASAKLDDGGYAGKQCKNILVPKEAAYVAAGCDKPLTTSATPVKLQLAPKKQKLFDLSKLGVDKAKKAAEAALPAASNMKYIVIGGAVAAALVAFLVLKGKK